MSAAASLEGFYVTVRDHGRTGLLLGPYGTKEEADASVGQGRKLAAQVNSWAHFYAYGVTRVTMQPGAALPAGKLNHLAQREQVTS